MVWRLTIDNTNFMTGEIDGIATMSIVDPSDTRLPVMLKQMQEKFGYERIIALVPSSYAPF